MQHREAIVHEHASEIHTGGESHSLTHSADGRGLDGFPYLEVFLYVRSDLPQVLQLRLRHHQHEQPEEPHEETPTGAPGRAAARAVQVSDTGTEATAFCTPEPPSGSTVKAFGFNDEFES